MIMRADIQNNTAVTTDAYGNPIPAVWAALSTIPCAAFTKVRREVIDGNKIVLVEDLKALFPLNAVVIEDYRIANIKDRLGVVLFAGPLNIRTIQRRRNHLEVLLDRIQS